MIFYTAHTYNLDTLEWTTTDFEKRRDALSYIKSQFKYPGEYNLKYTNEVWNEQATIFHKNERRSGVGHYPQFSQRSIDYRKHWDFEKEKCLFEGFIIYKKPSENLEFAVPCLYYWYLNYCPIPDKVKQKEDFPEIYDGDYHYFLYILQCILKRQYGVVLKKRQSGYSLKNMAIILNAIWFGKSAIAKIFAADISKVEESWSFMVLYRDHINNHCGWTRGFDPSKPLNWQVRRKQTDGSYRGNNSKAKGFTTNQNPTKGIGGSAKIIFGEESGANSTLDVTHEFITSNVALGGLVTGLIIYSGAVGKLEEAEPLKEFMFHPKKHGFLACPNNIPEDLELGDEVGFFAPEWWNYVSVERDEDDTPMGEAVYCYDEWGNTNKAQAMAEIEKWRAINKQKEPEKFRYYCSQRPLSIKEAFAWRKDSKWPLNLVQAQKRRIEEKQYPTEFLDIIKNEKGTLEWIKAAKDPIREFPFPKAAPDKEGCIEVHERPISGFEFGKHYVASVDPIREGKTSTSHSLFSIMIYKLDTEVIKYGEEVESYIEPGKLVAEWCGRFDDINKTHERAMYMLEMYGARAICEVNSTEFVNFMIFKKRQHYLVPKKQMLFLRELGANEDAFQEYGWYNTGRMFDALMRYGIEILKEEIDYRLTKEGEKMLVRYGVERFPSLMLMKEIEAHQPNMNVDRIITFISLAAYIKIYIANFGHMKRVENPDKKEVDKNRYVTPKSFFKVRTSNPNLNVKRSPFKNIK